jgi:hypothetical protein
MDLEYLRHEWEEQRVDEHEKEICLIEDNVQLNLEKENAYKIWMPKMVYNIWEMIEECVDKV